MAMSNEKIYQKIGVRFPNSFPVVVIQISVTMRIQVNCIVQPTPFCLLLTIIKLSSVNNIGNIYVMLC